jgi:hypothetical protein
LASTPPTDSAAGEAAEPREASCTAEGDAAGNRPAAKDDVPAAEARGDGALCIMRRALAFGERAGDGDEAACTAGAAKPRAEDFGETPDEPAALAPDGALCRRSTSVGSGESEASCGEDASAN